MSYISTYLWYWGFDTVVEGKEDKLEEEEDVLDLKKVVLYEVCASLFQIIYYC